MNNQNSNDPVDQNLNSIEPDSLDNDQYDQIPSANAAARDSSSSKKLKIMLALIFGILILLIGIGASIGRYQKSSTERKAIEAEQTAQEQKKMATNGGLNIAEDQDAIRNTNLQPLPPPSSIDPAVATAQNVQPVVEPQPVYQPRIQPRYNQYDTQPYQGAAAPAVAQAAPPAAVVDDSSVIIDVYGSKKALATGARETGLGSGLKSSQLANGTVSNRGDTSMLLAKGTTIPCVLKTKIDSTYKGFTTCQVSKDVYSANGRVLLLERGSSVFGEQNVDIKQGQARVAVLWSRIETPKGLSVNIDSPAAGQLGEVGIGAAVNNHFWQRFGGAILLSVIKDVSANASTQLKKDQDSENTTNVNNTSGTVDEMAEKILENTINIPPTATVKQGALINIMVVRDVDFGGLYAIRSY